MALPTQPVTLSVTQIEELSRHFSTFRHDVNGCLSLIVAATELIRYNPDVIKRMAATVVEQPPKIAGKLREFIEECERVIGVRSASDPSWYGANWKRTTVVAAAPLEPATLTQAQAKALHGELMQLGKEISQLGFTVSGVRSLIAMDGAHALETMQNVADQFTKAALQFNQAAAAFESTLKIEESGQRRLSGGAPSGPIALTAEQVALFHRRLMNLQRDMLEQLVPLLELSRLARHEPQELQKRAPEFTPQPPKISAEVTKFGEEFDKTFGIVRAA